MTRKINTRTSATEPDSEQLQIISHLRDPSSYPHPVRAIEIVETHISWVVLTGEYAYKIKKAVHLPFLDFTSLATRKHFCEEEIRLNIRLAASIYLDVVPIGGSSAAPRMGSEPAIEYAVKMRQFDGDARLDRKLAADAVDSEAIRRFATEIAEFHASEAPESTADSSWSNAVANVRELRELPVTGRFAHELAALEAWTIEREAQLSTYGSQRRRDGHIRECHGDLHLENVIVDGAKLVAFDALEFDPALRRIDTMNETAFLAMDLMAHERSDLAFDFLTQYLETCGDYAGLRGLPYFMVFRALVRAKVCALKETAHIDSSSVGNIAKYVRLAELLMAPARATLVITHGLSGSGKTFLTQSLIGPLRAIRVRSDLERKRLAGLSELASSDSPVAGGLYDARNSEQTYSKLHEAAASAVQQGLDCIVDAAFLERASRLRFRDLARSLGAGFVILDCAASENTLRARLDRRRRSGTDASEAQTAVLDYQLAHQEPLGFDETPFTLRIDTSADIDAAKLTERLLRTVSTVHAMDEA